MAANGPVTRTKTTEERLAAIEKSIEKLGEKVEKLEESLNQRFSDQENKDRNTEIKFIGIEDRLSKIES